MFRNQNADSPGAVRLRQTRGHLQEAGLEQPRRQGDLEARSRVPATLVDTTFGAIADVGSIPTVSTAAVGRFVSSATSKCPNSLAVARPARGLPPGPDAVCQRCAWTVAVARPQHHPEWMTRVDGGCGIRSPGAVVANIGEQTVPCG